MTRHEFVSSLNSWGSSRKPFLFIADFELQKPLAFLLDEINPSEILYDINGVSNAPKATGNKHEITSRKVISFEDYQKKFSHVARRLARGDSYLVNLTTKTEITLSQSLLDIFHSAKARYKLWLHDQCVVFSPECFIRIEDGRIFSFPMKGTIDAAVPYASDVILKNEKELAEHVTIVDLIRNDLSQVASDVAVTRFRYLDELKTNNKNLLQVSSEISGVLSDDYNHHLGDILMKLLPAGSISGAPKEMTINIIRGAEMENRGYYTGVFGYFDGYKLDSGVMIRYIEKDGSSFYYRSGGGITTQSSAEKEYQEILDKVYVPVA